jgi:hypothetical protein
MIHRPMASPGCRADLCVVLSGAFLVLGLLRRCPPVRSTLLLAGRGLFVLVRSSDGLMPSGLILARGGAGSPARRERKRRG